MIISVAKGQDNTNQKRKQSSAENQKPNTQLGGCVVKYIMCPVSKQKLVQIYVPVFTVLTQSVPVPGAVCISCEFFLRLSPTHCVDVKGSKQDGLQSPYLPEISCLEVQFASHVAFVQTT